MPVLNVTVRNKIAEGDKQIIVCDNTDYVVNFDLDSEWDEYQAKTMRVLYVDGTYTDVAFSGNECPLPRIYKPNIYSYFDIGIGIYAGNIHSTVSAIYKCYESVLTDAEPHTDPPEDIYLQILNLIQSGAVRGIGIASIEKTGTSGNVDTYTITYDDGATTTFTVTNGSVTSVDGMTGDIVLDNKANIDGSYDGMTVGSAQQLLASSGVEDKAPYAYRMSGGSMDIGDREELNEINGMTVAWNQLVQNGDFTSTSNWSISYGTQDVSNNELTVTISSDRTYALSAYTLNVLNGHKVLMMCDAKVGTALQAGLQFYNATSTPYSSNLISTTSSLYVRLAGICVAGDNLKIRLRLEGEGGQTAIFRNATAYDLTAMFGATVADYVYSLEQAQAGAGVAWFRALFPNSFYAYSAPTLMSVKTTGHKTVGFNQFDEETVLPTTGAVKQADGSWYWATGTTANDKRVWTNTLGYTGRICITATVKYSSSAASERGIIFRVYYTDGTNEYKTPSAGLEWVTVSLLTNANRVVDRIQLTYAKNSTSTWMKDICINLSWSGTRNGEYEAYVEHTYPLDSSLELRGIPKLDSNNKLYADGDIYAPSGDVTRKYGIVDLGSLTWVMSTVTDHNRFQANNLHALVKFATDNIICSKYPLLATHTSNFVSDKVIATSGSTQDNGRLWIWDDDYTSAADFKTAMSGVYLVYELATPTTETADPYQQTQVVDDWGTEEFIDSRNIAIPVGHKTNYLPNLRDKLQHLPSLASDDGYYVINQQDNTMSLELFRIPKAPSEDGTYQLKAIVTGGTPTCFWEAIV